jgi:hypothetical protein
MSPAQWVQNTFLAVAWIVFSAFVFLGYGFCSFVCLIPYALFLMVIYSTVLKCLDNDEG